MGGPVKGRTAGKTMTGHERWKTSVQIEKEPLKNEATPPNQLKSGLELIMGPQAAPPARI